MMWKRATIGVLALIMFAGGLRSQSVGVGAGPGPDFEQQLELAYSRLIAMKKWDARQDAELKADIGNLTDRYVLARLNGGSASAASLQHDLNEAFSSAIGHMSSENLRKFWGEVHYASVLRIASSQGGFVVGYTIPHGNTSLDVVEVAQRVSGSYRFTARAGAEMRDHTLRLALMRSPTPTHVRILAYGARLGANDSPLAVVLYRFDGRSLSALWSRFELWQGSVKIGPDHVMLMFRDAARFEKGRPPYFLQERYKGTSTGLKLVSRHWADDR